MSAQFCVLPSEAVRSLCACEEKVPYLRLPHPRTDIPSLFLPIDNGDVATNQVLELQAINPMDSRSWFLGNEVIAGVGFTLSSIHFLISFASMTDGKLLLMTPVDPVFLLLPVLSCIQPNDGSAGQFKPADDMLEEAALRLQEQSQSRKDGRISNEDILRLTNLRCARNALKHICDIKEITEEITVYRYSRERVLDYLRKKVIRLSTPSTLEKSKTIIRSLAKDGLMEDGNEELLKIGQLRAACELVGHYLSPTLRDMLYASYDFTKLDTFLKSAIDEAMTSIAASQNKKAGNKTTTEGKKRKAAKGSLGVETLKKVNVDGMAKLSTFFKKADKV
ncbi:hypothetical protein AGABI2DRAFT_192416 [Agaricus bisporus var. bisporus H97]|uniref:hypothetical protein n=1 Tax=Agaricus bisporus var. bisporus (strain H97 / ATCC MYA-4626 / FGSC 10389) TaxID=936046 RepID=UPI00029F7B8C|nr:hypothetical protein AGABI2DRAFT_192416 [Agaricus bisporus var. bisporus H97]EKV47169.1 hypothetical protein AGABI2DRAFT_192416 [Agaricus bisporus var. bisporus H97]